MVADSMPSFDERSLEKDTCERFKSKEGKENKFKEKHQKEDLNLMSKHDAAKAEDGYRKNKFNNHQDNKLNEFERDDSPYEISKKEKYVLEILKDPKGFERRSGRSKSEEKPILENDKQNLDKMTAKGDMAGKLQCSFMSEKDRLNFAFKEKNCQLSKEVAAETSVKETAQVAIEHEEKMDVGKDEMKLLDDRVKSLDSLKSLPATDLKNCKMGKTKQRRELENKWKQVLNHELVMRHSENPSSLIKTTLNTVKDNINAYLKLNMNLAFDADCTGIDTEQAVKGREIYQTEVVKNAEELGRKQGHHNESGTPDCKNYDILNTEENKLHDSSLKIGKTSPDEQTVHLENKDMNVAKERSRIVKRKNLKNTTQNFECMVYNISMSLKRQTEEIAQFKNKFNEAQKYLHVLSTSSSLSGVTEYTQIEVPIPECDTTIYIPECLQKRYSPLNEHQNFKCRQSSSRGDNSKGNNNHSRKENGQKNSERDDNRGSDKEFSRKNDNEKDRDEQEDPFDPPDDDQCDGQTSESPTDNYGKTPNYKYRRKHGILEGGSLQLAEIIGKLKDINENVPPDLLGELNICLINCLTSSNLDDTEHCHICICISSLICHFGGCSSDYVQCHECIPMFSLIVQHVTMCMEASRSAASVSCSIILCHKIATVASQDIEVLKKKSNKLWKKLKKYMARYGRLVGGTAEFVDSDDLFSMSSLRSISSLRGAGADVVGSIPTRIHRPSTSFLPSLGIIPEKGKKFATPTAVGRGRAPPKSKSEPLYRKLPDGTVISLKNEAGQSTSRQQRHSTSEYPLHSVGASKVPSRKSHSEILYRRQYGQVDLTTSEEKPPEKKKLSLVRKVSFKLTEKNVPETVDEVDQKLIEESEDSSEAEEIWDEATYGPQGIISLPIGFQVLQNRIGSSDQLMSLVEAPTGIPGIGEVVYGTRHQLLTVIRHWTELKNEYNLKGALPQRHLREEGVILEEAKNAKLLRIFGTRYQKNFQWIRMTHLGSGMSGKCHLCMDYNTEFKFCIKKIHISKYEEGELDIWSELKHRHVVRFLGAMRYGEKIYIIQDFIDGGCLTETINRQKQTKRRLSHWTALCYLKQILEVLQYFERKGIIHEDLKADNILLVQNTNKIAVTDFGVARRINNPSSFKGGNPLGTPTQLSPEKAQSKGHGFKSDVWSAICVLVHMLSGNPPWVKRYPHVKLLNYIIVENSPPLQDVPENISLDVQELIRQGFTVNPNERPNAEQLLLHKAFKLLDGNDPDTFSSTLLTSTREIPDTRLLLEETENSKDEDLLLMEQVRQDLQNKPGNDDDITPENRASASVGSPELDYNLNILPNASILSAKSVFTVNTFSAANGLVSISAQDSALDQLEGKGFRSICQSFGGKQNREKSVNGAEGIHRQESVNGRDDNQYAMSGDLKQMMEEWGVSLPPDYKTLLENDRTDFYSEHLFDKMENFTAKNKLYKNFLFPYVPEVNVRPVSDPEDVDIEKIIEQKNYTTGLPVFDLLFPQNSLEEKKTNRPKSPDILKQMNTMVIENMMNRSGSSSTNIDEFQRSTSHKEESEKLDEELSRLGQELEHVQIEPLDLIDHQSLMKVLNQPANNEINFDRSNSALSSLRKSETEKTPSDSTPVQTISESPADPQSPIKTMAHTDQKFQIKNGSQIKNLEEPVTLPVNMQVPDFKDHGPATLPVLLTDFTEHEESFLSDELFASGPKANQDNFQPCTYTKSTTLMQAKGIEEENYPTPTPKVEEMSYTPSVIQNNNIQDNFKNSRTEGNLTNQPTMPYNYRQKMLEHAASLMNTPSTAETMTEDEHLSFLDQAPMQKGQEAEYLNSNSESNTSARKTSPRPHLDLSKSPNTRRKEYARMRPNKSNPEIESFLSSPTPVPHYLTPQVQIPALEVPVSATGGDTSGLGASLPYFRTHLASRQRQDSDSSGIMTTPPFRSSSHLDDSDLEIQKHFNDVIEHVEEALSQSSHDTSHYHLSMLEGEQTSFDKSPTSCFEVSTEEEESLYVQQYYLPENTGEDAQNGTRVIILRPDRKRCVSINLPNEHGKRSWKDIIETDLCEQIHLKGFRKFSLIDADGHPIDLNLCPGGSRIELQIVEPTEQEQEWWCENSIMFDKIM